jgi:hypothetical protein
MVKIMICKRLEQCQQGTADLPPLSAYSSGCRHYGSYSRRATKCMRTKETFEYTEHEWYPPKEVKDES